MKMIDCHKVNPSSDCAHVVRAESEEELMSKAEAHAREHGLEPTPELMEKVRSFVEEEEARA